MHRHAELTEQRPQRQQLPLPFADGAAVTASKDAYDASAPGAAVYVLHGSAGWLGGEGRSFRRLFLLGKPEKGGHTRYLIFSKIMTGGNA